MNHDKQRSFKGRIKGVIKFMIRKLILTLISLTLIFCLSATAFADDSTAAAAETTTTTETATNTAAAAETAPAQTAAQIKAEKYQKGLAAYIRSRNKKISKARAYTLAGYFIKYGNKYNVDPKALMAMAQHESTFRAKAYNPAGYYGIMQTSASLGRSKGFSKRELFQAQNSIKVAASYLRYNLKVFHYNYSKGIAGYCCGTYAVKKGNYSRKTASVRVKTRAKIAKYLKNHNYV
jgi:soluble lytic murein transglycosylase-like protein